MSTVFKKGFFAFAVLAVFAACTPRSPQIGLIPPPLAGVTKMDDTPPPCPTCDSGGGMPK
jgi:hypothetical protein